MRSLQYEQHSTVGSSTAKPQLLLSQTCVIDVDPVKRSDQAERVILHHDVIHNPANAFHFQLEWMGTTAKCIQDLVRQWNRGAHRIRVLAYMCSTACQAIERNGLKIVEAYVDQITDIRTKNVFQSCLPVRLAVIPPALPPGSLSDNVRSDIYFECAILRKFEFILDADADSSYSDKVNVVYSYRASPFTYTQFVHRTGAAFVQVIGGHDGFRWLKNRLLQPERMISTAVAAGVTQHPLEDLCEVVEGVRMRLEAFCADEDALRAFYDETFQAIPPPNMSPTTSTTQTNSSAIE